MNRFKLLYFVIFIINLYEINAQISDKRLCVDEKCEVPISLAKTLLRYSSPDSRILSFAPNVEITIYSKSAGSREDLWGAEINGKRGYIPKHMVRETKFFKKPTILVNTEFSNETDNKQVPSKVEPDKVQEPYEVIDGTTIYPHPQDDIVPSSTESPIQPTALPPSLDVIIQNEESIKPDQEKNESNGNAEEAKIDEVNDKIKSGEEISNSNASIASEQKQDEKIISNESAESEQQGEEEVDEDGEVDDEDEDDDSGEEDEESEQSEEKVPEVKLDVDEATKTSEKNETIEESQKEKETIEVVQDEGVQMSSSTLPSAEAVNSDTFQNASSVVVSAESVVSDSINSETTHDQVQAESEKDKIPIDSVQPPLILNLAENISSSAEASAAEDLTTPPTIEVTSLNPEMEVPKPFDDVVVDVTPNPIEQETKEPLEENLATPLPPGQSKDSPVGNTAASEFTENEAPVEKIDVQNDEKIEQTPISETESSDSQNAEVEDISSGPSPETLDSVNETQTSEETKESDREEAIIDELSDPPAAEDNSQTVEIEETVEESSGPGFLGGLMSMLGMQSEEKSVEEQETLTLDHMVGHVEDDVLLSSHRQESQCDGSSCETSEVETNAMDLFNFNPDFFLYLVTTAVSVIIFLFGYIAFDKSKREGPLVAKINTLEKQLLVVVKENQLLQEKLSTDSGYDTNDKVPNEVVESLKQELENATKIKNSLEEQIQSLEKELENSTEVGMELNKMLSEILSSENGSDVIKSNVEHLQRQLVEQQSTINSINETLAVTNTENHELRLELELSNKKVIDLQSELDKLLLNILKIEEEKETQQSTLENEIANYRQRYEEINDRLKLKEEEYSNEIRQSKNRSDQTERKLELKTKEYEVLTETIKQLKSVKNAGDSVFQDILEVGGIKAELQLLKSENQRFSEKLQHEQELKSNYEKRAQSASDELRQLKASYDEADKMRTEMQTKLEVLSNYFKDREAQWQKELSKHEALWAEKEGEATSTTERIKFMQEQLQNYKAQTDSLKQEIMSQEIELKSQISVLEKKAHENWVSARQAERKLEDAKQEAAQLRHRLTLRERTIQEDKNQPRLQSPIEQNGDLTESPASPLLYGSRDHITKSPPLPGLPPFLPPPPGVPFMPPPIHGVPPFIPPPPPNMFPGDHRPPPLGRMSSPPLNSRYSPSSRGYSPYDRNSSSPSDSEYGTSPPHRRAYSPFNSREDRREYKRPPPGRTNGRNLIKGGASSGSGNSNESLEKINRQQSKV